MCENAKKFTACMMFTKQSGKCWFTYSKEQVKPITCPIMKQNIDFQEGISQATANPLPTRKLLTTNERFQIR